MNINFENKEEVLEILLELFPPEPIPTLSKKMLTESYFFEQCYDEAYTYFSNHSWLDLIKNLNLEKDSTILEYATSFMDKDIFRYYIPFYIYACLLNDGWAFEDCFISGHLSPYGKDQDEFLNYFMSLNDKQLKLFAQFIYYEMQLDRGDRDIEDAFNNFWYTFIN